MGGQIYPYGGMIITRTPPRPPEKPWVPSPPSQRQIDIAVQTTMQRAREQAQRQAEQARARERAAREASERAARERQYQEQQQHLREQIQRGQREQQQRQHQLQEQQQRQLQQQRDQQRQLQQQIEQQRQLQKQREQQRLLQQQREQQVGVLGKTKDVTGLKSPWADPTDLLTFGMGGVGAKAGSKGVSFLGRIFGRIFAKRSASSAARLASQGIAGPLGKLTSAEIQKAIAASGERTVELYTKLSLAPAAGRAISFTTDRALADAARSGGQVFMVRVPDALLRKLEYIGVAARSTTMMGGVVGTEVRILPQAADLIRGFLVH